MYMVQRLCTMDLLSACLPKSQISVHLFKYQIGTCIVLNGKCSTSQLMCTVCAVYVCVPSWSQLKTKLALPIKISNDV